jgi:RNA 3'-terminal phosphate cyclase (ATP)
LLLPLALAGSGSFRTTKPSLHTTTNAGIIQSFIPVRIGMQQESELVWKVAIS